MDALEAEAAYRLARHRLDTGQITLHEYNTVIAGLLYQDNSGIWWAISPADGSWLKWNGSAWAPGFEQAEPGAPQGPSQQAPYLKAQQDGELPAMQEPAKPPRSVVLFRSLRQPVRAEPGGEVESQPGPLTAEEADALPPSSLPPADETQQLVASPHPVTAEALPAAAGSADFIQQGAMIAGVLLGIASWFVYPYILGIPALVAGGYALFSARRTTERIPPPAVFAIIIALAAMLVTSFSGET